MNKTVRSRTSIHDYFSIISTVCHKLALGLYSNRSGISHCVDFRRAVQLQPVSALLCASCQAVVISTASISAVCELLDNVELATVCSLVSLSLLISVSMTHFPLLISSLAPSHNVNFCFMFPLSLPSFSTPPHCFPFHFLPYFTPPSLASPY